MTLKVMGDNESIFDAFLSYSSSDKDWVRLLSNGLTQKGLRIFLDETCIRPGDNILLKISQALDTSRHLVLVLSQASLSSKWTQMESSAARWLDPNNEEHSIIPILLSNCPLPKILQPIKYIDAREGRPIEEVVEEVASVVGRSNTELIERKGQTISATNSRNKVAQLYTSLQHRLRRDFFTAGSMCGQFGATDGNSESSNYHPKSTEDIKIKPAYFLTYWGWKACLLILQEMLDKNAKLTSDFIQSRFGANRWVEVELEDYGLPSSHKRIVQTVRHTAKAAEILLLLKEKDHLVSQVAWQLLHESSELINTDGGWKEFRGIQQSSSLWASCYVFRLLSELSRSDDAVDLLGDKDRFLEESSPLLERTEQYLLSEWATRRWETDTAPWYVNAPLALIEYAPFSTNINTITHICETLLELVAPSGCLIDQTIGYKNKIAEYALTTRISYALRCTDTLLQTVGYKSFSISRWLLNNYSESQILNTCDIAFLAEHLQDFSTIA